jgi:hypothetical protein
LPFIWTDLTLTFTGSQLDTTLPNPWNGSGWGWSVTMYNSTGTRGSLFFLILPELDNAPLYNTPAGATQNNGWQVITSTGQTHDGNLVSNRPLKTYIAPGDPTQEEDVGRTSYLANQLVFKDHTAQPRRRFPAGISDGAPNTIAFAEGYSRAAQLVQTGWPWSMDPATGNWLPWTWTYGLGGIVDRTWTGQNYIGYTAPDPNNNPNNNPPFQVKPIPENNVQGVGPQSDLAQAYSSSGLQVSLFDGSVRLVRPNVTLATWRAVSTPDANDVPGSEW